MYIWQNFFLLKRLSNVGAHVPNVVFRDEKVVQLSLRLLAMEYSAVHMARV